MKTYNLIYTNSHDLIRYAAENSLDTQGRYLIRIHTSIHTSVQAQALATDILKVFPNSSVAGTTAYGVICNSRIYERKCLISITSFNDSKFGVDMLRLSKYTPVELAKASKAFINENTKAAFVFFTDYYKDAFAYVEEFNVLYPGVKLSGGLVAAQNELCNDSYVFTNDGVFRDALMIVTIEGKDLMTYGNVIMGHEAIGDIYTITGTDGEYITEIDSQKAADWFRNLLGVKELTVMNDELSNARDDILVKFPLILEEHNGSSRFSRFIAQTDSIKLYYSALPENLRFRIGYLSPLTSVLECKKICKEIDKVPVESLFVYSCCLKRTLMYNGSEWELTPFSNTDISGAFLGGEIGHVNDTNEYFNGTCSIISFAESQRFINIDYSAFRKMENIKDDNKDVLNYVLKMQSNSMLAKNEQLSNQVLKQEAEAVQKVFLDAQTGLYEVTKFSYDNEDKKFNKICMISIEKGDILRGHYGSADFEKILKQNIRNAKDFFEEYDFNFYSYNNCTFLIAATADFPKEKFMDITEDFYQTYGTFYIKELHVTCLNNVSVVLDEDEKLIEKASITLINASNEGKRYQVYKSEMQDTEKITEAIKWVDIISDAVACSRVIPYFQPIYSNVSSCVNKFESLMRIQGKNGEIYLPGQFMKIAKDYKLYCQISKQMIAKVFDLFSNRNEIVSINISAYDINSDEMKDFIYKRIKTLSHPQNFIFEIVESEELQNYESMYEFVKHVTDNKIKIAIDDFGSGYSNLVEIAKLRPDFIKIDGEIIKNINKSMIHRSIAETVIYMADKLNVELIAEFVESDDLQETIMSNNIEYSQGYYFSKPIPFDQIDEFLKKYNK
ncbi:MAG: EAL domain-containing protein [Oscillospiraceae bacterium]|nr:EAL domain-containing protein [Oscillospiraceae bacterium]